MTWGAPLLAGIVAAIEVPLLGHLRWRGVLR